jgi:hypothetical protein
MVRHTRRKNRSRRLRRGGGTDTYTELTSIPDEGTSSTGGRRKRRGGTMGGRRSRKQKGGDGSADWVLKNFGDGNTQWQNTFGPQSIAQGNNLTTLPGAIAVVNGTLPQGIASNAAPAQFGGRRKKKKGGFWGNAISQALVPFTLLFAQNRFSKRSRK